MTADELRRCREELARLRRRVANVDRGDIESLALAVGYALRPKKGGHPVYTKHGRLPITIPGHRNKLNRNTVAGILNRLEEELDRLEEELDDGS